MNKFTSGEWVVDESRHYGCINRLEPFRHIGMVSTYQAVAGDREENEANARLIAAAPDLLEALQKIQFRCECFLEDDRDMKKHSIEAIKGICDREIDKALTPQS